MSPIRSFDHVGITVADIDTVTGFFAGLGFETECRRTLDCEFLDTVIGMPNSLTELVMLRPPDGGTGLELASFIRPNHEAGSPDAMANELGLRSVAFEVDDLEGVLDRLAAGRLPPRRRRRSARRRLAHGVCARTRGDHRVLGPTNRLILAHRRRP